MDRMDAEPAPRRTSARWRRARPLAFFALPAVLAFVGYASTLRDFFLADDFGMLLHASLAEDWASASNLGGGWEVRWFRPLAFWSWWLEFPLFGLEPLGYRATNLLAHALVAGLCAWLVAILTGRDGIGVAAGAAFAVLPNHAEAVTWTSARFDPLCALGMLTSILAWIRWFTAERPRAWHLVLCALALLFALACKEIGFGVLLMIPVLTLGFLGRPSRRHWLGYAILLAVGAIWFAARWQALGGIGGMVVEDGPPLQMRADLWQIRLFTGQAFRFAFAPLWLERVPAWHPLVSLPLAAALIALALCAWSGNAGRFLRLAVPFLVLFLVSLLPMVTWVRLGPDGQSSRYLYVPTLFTCAIFGVAFGCVGDTRKRAALGAILAAVAVGVWLRGLVLENRVWSEASRITRVMLETFPSAEEMPEQHVAVTAMTDNYEGAYVFRSSFSQAVWLFCRPRRQIHELTPRDWAIELERRRGPVAFLRWDEALERWVRGARKTPDDG